MDPVTAEHVKTSENPPDVAAVEESKKSADDVAPKLATPKLTPEQVEEQKLKAKYPQGGFAKPGGSLFLQKRILQRGQKPNFFDSGDYNMAKAGKSGRSVLQTQKLVLGPAPTGDTIPTPETVPNRKSSIHTKSHLVS